MLVWHLKGSKLTRRQILTAQQDIWHDIPLLTSWVGNTCQNLPRQNFVRDRWEPVGASGKLRSGQEIGEEAEKGKKNLRQIEALSFPINVQVTKYTCTKSEVSNTFSRFMASYLSSYWKYIWYTWHEFNATDGFGPDLTKIRNNLSKSSPGVSKYELDEASFCSASSVVWGWQLQ